MNGRQTERITELLQAARERSALDETSAFNILSALHLERYETRTHSRIIFFLLNSRRGPKERDGFLRLFLQTIGIPRAFLGESWSVYREKTLAGGSGRMDFVLESKSFCAVIEMKVDAGDGDSQIARYASYCRKKRKEYAVYYLTLDGHMPEEQSVRGVGPDEFRCIGFDKEIVQWLRRCMASAAEGGYKHSFLQQYLGAVCQAAGMEEEGTGVKDLLNSSEMARAAQTVANSFHEKMNDMTELFFEKLCMEIRKKTKLEVFPYTNCADIFLETFTRKNQRCLVVMGVGIDTFLYVGVGFCEETEDGNYPYLPLTEAKARFPGIYKKWMEKLDALENFAGLRQSKWTKWKYLEDSEGARLNFKDHTAQIKLMDELDRQCKFISDCLVVDLILPLCR